MTTISELEQAYEQAHERLLRGELDDEEFQARIETLRYQDAQGREWKIGWYTGKWYRHDQGQWIQDIPAERRLGGHPLDAPAGLRQSRNVQRQRRRSRAVWLAAGIACVLLATSVSLILGWNGADKPAGRAAGVSGSPSPTATPPATISPPAMATGPGPSPTAPVEMTAPEVPKATARVTASPSPSSTARVTASPSPPRTARATTTGTPVPAPTESPSPTPTETQSPVATATARRAAPRPTPLPALSGQIFFPVYDSNPDRRTMDVYAVRLPSGGRKIVLGQASQPALSRDGKRLAFRSWDSAQRGILVRELVLGNTWTWVNYGEAAHPSWGPDNNSIVFASQQESDRQWRLYRALGLQVDRVSRHGVDIFGRVPFWLADGRIVYWECPENKCGLYIMKGNGTSPVRLTMVEHDTAPAASPDGSRIAFMSNRNGNWDIFIVDINRPEGPEGQGLTRVTSHGARDGLPTWSPDGQWLAFATDRDGAWAVWVTRPDGSNQRKLFDLGGPPEGQIAAVTDQDQHGWTWESMAWGP